MVSRLYHLRLGSGIGNVSEGEQGVKRGRSGGVLLERCRGLRDWTMNSLYIFSILFLERGGNERK